MKPHELNKEVIGVLTGTHRSDRWQVKPPGLNREVIGDKWIQPIISREVIGDKWSQPDSAGKWSATTEAIRIPQGEPPGMSRKVIDWRGTIQLSTCCDRRQVKPSGLSRKTGSDRRQVKPHELNKDVMIVIGHTWSPDSVGKWSATGEAILTQHGSDPWGASKSTGFKQESESVTNKASRTQLLTIIIVSNCIIRFV